jgi:hypothetical protein
MIFLCNPRGKYKEYISNRDPMTKKKKSKHIISVKNKRARQQD